MENVKSLLINLCLINNNSSSIDESWGYLKLSGHYYNEFYNHISELNKILKSINLPNLLQLDFDGDNVKEEEFKEYQSIKKECKEWKLQLNKLAIISNSSANVNFFIKSDFCEKWISGINLLSDECPLIKHMPLRIVISDLKTYFGGHSLGFVPLASESFDFHEVLDKWIPPSDEKIKENVHFITSDKIQINLRSHILCVGDLDNSIAKLLKNKSAVATSITLVNEYYSLDKVVIDGIRRIPLTLFRTEDIISEKFHEDLSKTIEWIYEDRISTRRKLFNERLSLEISEGESFISSLSKHMNSALAQAKERYNFVIIERKDAYVKELKDLLKDIKIQSELYAQKVRNLLSNFLRDILAALLLIGFTIFTKFSDNLSLDKNNLLSFVFTSLGIYYILSAVMQSVIDWTDINISKKEMLYWKNSTKELIPEKDFNSHINNSLYARRLSLKILYPIIFILYILISCACFLYPYYFKNYINQLP